MSWQQGRTDPAVSSEDKRRHICFCTYTKPSCKTSHTHSGISSCVNTSFLGVLLNSEMSNMGTLCCLYTEWTDSLDGAVVLMPYESLLCWNTCFLHRQWRHAGDIMFDAGLMNVGLACVWHSYDDVSQLNLLLSLLCCYRSCWCKSKQKYMT